MQEYLFFTERFEIIETVTKLLLHFVANDIHNFSPFEICLSDIKLLKAYLKWAMGS